MRTHWCGSSSHPLFEEPPALQAAVTVTPARIPELLLGLATVRPVFIWGAPGIGKSSLVRAFAESLGLECVSLLGTQLAPEDLIGVPQIREGRSVFCPPEAIARDEPYCLFLDELNAATPGIPRAGRYFPPEEIARCTFGVVLDTSGSMDRVLLGKALGAIASYAEARDVPAARVVFCDAAPHDAGYLPVTEIAGRVRVHGRGGTVLQPGIDLLHRADDFPPGAPVLIITDGWCDALRVRREHAYLILRGARLPFSARGPVFRVS
ncbi:AAA family ATPase [Streptomyces coeruleorubidus]|uniref:AAA family ATPase n=1 Tax=Streptomyces coeruleorubidus TaxID=116188 RepID=UPI003F540454